MSSIRFTGPRSRVTFDPTEGLVDALNIIGRDADRRVPVGDERFANSGRLRDSQVRKVQGNTGGIGYTDPAAVPAHERLDIAPGNGRQRKFLESALNANREAILRALAEGVRKGMS